MSFTNKGGKFKEQFNKKSSGSVDNCLTDEEISGESVSDSAKNLKDVSIERNHKISRIKRKTVKIHSCRLNVSLRYVKSNRYCRTKNESRKTCRVQKSRKSTAGINHVLEKTTEICHKGKRGLLGGKAKAKPPEEETNENHESDDNSDSSYFSRISLGYFQKFKDYSGASTSYQGEGSYKNSLYDTEDKCSKISEERELLDLQNWGMTAFVSSPIKKNESLDKGKEIETDTS